MKIERKSCFVATDFTRESIKWLLHTGINDVHCTTGHEGPEGEGVEVICTFSLTSVLDVVGGQRPHRNQSLDRPAQSDSLYRLRNPRTTPTKQTKL